MSQLGCNLWPRYYNNYEQLTAVWHYANNGITVQGLKLKSTNGETGKEGGSWEEAEPELAWLI